MLTNPALLRKTTGRLYWKPTGESGFIDFGNCTSHKQAPDVQRVDHYKYRRGLKRCDLSLVNTLKPVRVFTFDEHLGEVLRVMNFSLPTEVVQDAAADVLFDHGAEYPVQSEVYDLESINPGNIRYGGDGVPVEGVDWRIDAAGLVHILTTYWTDNEAQFSLLYDAPEITRLNFEVFSRLLEQGSFRFVEEDQHDLVPITNETLTGTVYVTAWGDGASDKYQEYTVEVLSLE